MKRTRIFIALWPTTCRIISAAALLARLGFEKEGYAKDYLLIDGQWRDHVLTALTTPDWSADVKERG